jgi:hypothetical protein
MQPARQASQRDGESASRPRPSASRPPAGQRPGHRPLTERTTRIPRYLAQQGAQQCGPCRFGLPASAGDFARLAAGLVIGLLTIHLEGPWTTGLVR